MPGKSKQDYLDLPYNDGDNRSKIILSDAVSEKGLEPTFKCLKFKAGGQVEVCLCQGMTEHTGVGSSKAEAIADAAGKF